MTEFVIRNTHKKPVVDRYPNAGAILPYISRNVDGDDVPIRFTEEEVKGLDSLGESVPVPDGLRTTPLDDMS